MINFALYIYKGFHFHFPYAAFEWELAMLVLMAFIENSRLMLASRGNKTEQIPPLIWSIALSIPMIVGFSFFLTIQTYVMRIDIILNTIALVFVSLGEKERGKGGVRGLDGGGEISHKKHSKMH